MKIEIKKGFAGSVFGEIHSRHFSTGMVYEVTVDIDEELADVALREGWGVIVDEPEEKVLPVTENKLITDYTTKEVKKRKRSVKKG